MPLDTVKLSALKAISRPKVGEIVAVYFPAPIGTKYYGSTALQDLANFATGLTLKPIEPRFAGFQDFELSAGISDDYLTLNFADADQAIASYFRQSGHGVKVEIFLWFPEIDWLVSVWWGLTHPPKSGDYESYEIEVSPGFMSSQLLSPRRGFYFHCPAKFGGTLETMSEVDANDCQYDRHLGGTRGMLFGTQPFTTCSKTKNACLLRWVTGAGVEPEGEVPIDPPPPPDTPHPSLWRLPFLGFDTDASPIVSDPRGNVIAVSRGNENNLKRPLRVVIGVKNIRDLDVLAWRKEPNNNTPDKGFVSAVWAVCEGEIQSMFQINVNGTFINEIEHVNYRGGGIRQPPTTYAPNISNFSGTTHVFARYGWINAQNTDVTKLQTMISIIGLKTIRTYTDANTYTTGFTRNRVWGLMEIYANRRWGRGYAYSRFDIPSWIDTANWTFETVRFTDPFGKTYDDHRSFLDIDLQGRPTQQQIINICRTGRISVPFQSEGKYKIVPLRKEANLSSVPVFQDFGQDRNICRDERGKPMLTYSQMSDAELPNKIVLTYEQWANEDAPNDFNAWDIERPLVFEDEQQQKAAGKLLGDNGLHVVEKRFSADGIRFFNMAYKLGWSLLHLGEFDSGGTKNNLRINFTTWLVDALELQPYQVIRVLSPLISGYGFEYFRIMKIRKRKDMKVDVVAQAYPVDYYESFETSTTLSMPEASASIGKATRGQSSINSVTYADGKLSVTIA